MDFQKGQYLFVIKDGQSLLVSVIAKTSVKIPEISDGSVIVLENSIEESKGETFNLGSVNKLISAITTLNSEAIDALLSLIVKILLEKK